MCLFMILGAGCALTGQQTEVIISHYFREKLTIAQRLVRMAPSVGNVLVTLLVGYLCTVYTGDIVVMIYGAIIMQNCFFLAAYTRPIYIEKVIRTTYNMLRAVEDDDEVIFSNQNQGSQNRSQENRTRPVTVAENVVSTQDEDSDVVVYNSRRNAKEVLDPEMQNRENSAQPRFSSDFSAMFDAPSNRFSSDFGAFDITQYGGVSGYQELENIDRDGQIPQPLYRETTVDAHSSGLVFSSDVTPGTARRTATLKKNFITIMNMLLDLNFYLYTLLHLCTTYSIIVLGLIFPPMLWELNPSLNIWSVSKIILYYIYMYILYR